MGIVWPWTKQPKSKIVWIDLGDLGDLVHPDGPHEQWQDHGLGLLRTILHQAGIQTDIVSTRAVTSWEQLRKQLVGYEMALMNVRSYTFPPGQKAAQIFKEVNPNGIVLAGGMHATVAPDEMLEIVAFDHVCQGQTRLVMMVATGPGPQPHSGSIGQCHRKRRRVRALAGLGHSVRSIIGHSAIEGALSP
jgi:hypothetical protein